MRVRRWLLIGLGVAILGVGTFAIVSPPAGRDRWSAPCSTYYEPPVCGEVLRQKEVLVQGASQGSIMRNDTSSIMRHDTSQWLHRLDEQTASPPPQPITLDAALASLRAANVAFNTPDQARVGKQFIVEAKLSTHLRREDMSVLIEEPGRHEVATLKVSDRMVATLAGGSAFDIAPSGPKEQWISDQELTEWDWQVTPKSVGDQVLILSFDAVISLNGKEDRRTINTFKRRITVAVGWPETAGEWLDFIKKTGEDVSWIWVTLLIPIGGGLWALIKRRTRPAKPTETVDLS